ncbi:MAG: TatA/E family twin arginine-targeting protein translocase [Spirulina sp. SIO3F2]|nr:TatA/E family twin arginine-targeting protein translocase [Spirulina sp. SIO3F2]
MNFFGIGLPEMVLIFIVGLLIFGPKKLPEIGRSLGKAIRGFQDATNEFKNEFQQEVSQIEDAVKMQAQLEPDPAAEQAEATESTENAADEKSESTAS